MGISDVELLDEDSPDDDGNGDVEGEGEGEELGRDASPGTPWWRQLRLPRGPVAVLTAALLLVLAAAGYAFARQSQSSDDFNPVLTSAQYSAPSDDSGTDLVLDLRNSGSAMLELTGVTVVQPGLIRRGADGSAAVGGATAAVSLAMPPGSVRVVTIPFLYDCDTSATAAPTASIGLTGLSASGTAHSIRLPLPQGLSPWDSGSLRAAACAQPTPSAELSVGYGGIGDTLMELTPVRFNYTIVLTAPAATSVTVSGLIQDNPGIDASTDPALPLTVLDGQTVRLTVTWRVGSCAIATAAQYNDGVVITASTGGAAQNWHADLGTAFERDLHAEIVTVCPGTP